MPDEKQYKGKDTFNNYAKSDGIKYDELTPNVQGLFDDLSQHFSPSELVITSGRRGNNEKSHHFDGGAIDIRPNPKVWDFLVNTPEGIKIMNDRGLNIIDESNPTLWKDTHASGTHFHIGSDSTYSNVVKMSDRYNKINDGESISVIQPFSQAYEKVNNLTIDYSQPLEYSSDMLEKTFNSLPQYKTNTSSYYSGNMSGSVNHVNKDSSKSNEGGYVFGLDGVTSNKVTASETDRLRKEVEELKKYNEKTDEEEALAKKQEEYISKQQAEMSKKVEILNAYKSLTGDRGSIDFEDQSIERQKQALAQSGFNNFRLEYSPTDIPDFSYSVPKNEV